MDITFPNNTKDTIDKIRQVIGRNITILIPTFSGCSVCNLDPVTNLSTDSFCENCNGKYWIETFSGYITLAHINWGKTDVKAWFTGGQIFNGDCLIQIEYSPENLSAVELGKVYIVDGKKLRKENQIYRGVQSLNRILIELTEVEK